jgi:hypothetical protein
MHTNVHPNRRDIQKAYRSLTNQRCASNLITPWGVAVMGNDQLQFVADDMLEEISFSPDFSAENEKSRNQERGKQLHGNKFIVH